jgi:exopolyphosphatase/guanosine-5'-triphosphate,3'-diphosphate pyrophosphatase
MEDKISRELLGIREKLANKGYLPFLENAVLVGTAGTATTLAAISLKMTDYDYRLVNNYVVGIDEIKEIFSILLPMKPEQRLTIPGLEKGREDLIIAGALITIKTMEYFGFNRLKVSDFGLLEGVLLSV